MFRKKPKASQHEGSGKIESGQGEEKSGNSLRATLLMGRKKAPPPDQEGSQGSDSSSFNSKTGASYTTRFMFRGGESRISSLEKDNEDTT